MDVLQLLACRQDRRDEAPNQELARQLAANQDRGGIAVIAAHLWDENPAVSSDCIKVLYETGYLKPELIAPHAAAFFGLLRRKNNRLVWGAMIALSTIAALVPQEVGEQLELVLKTMQNGSVISEDAGVRTLAGAASASAEINDRVVPILLRHLGTCRPKSLAMRLEDMSPAFTRPADRAAAAAIAEKRSGELTPAQQQKVSRILRKWLQM